MATKKVQFVPEGADQAAQQAIATPAQMTELPTASYQIQMQQGADPLSVYSQMNPAAQEMTQKMDAAMTAFSKQPYASATSEWTNNKVAGAVAASTDENIGLNVASIKQGIDENGQAYLDNFVNTYKQSKDQNFRNEAQAIVMSGDNNDLKAAKLGRLANQYRKPTDVMNGYAQDAASQNIAIPFATKGTLANAVDSFNRTPKDKLAAEIDRYNKEDEKRGDFSTVAHNLVSLLPGQSILQGVDLSNTPSAEDKYFKDRFAKAREELEAAGGTSTHTMRGGGTYTTQNAKNVDNFDVWQRVYEQSSPEDKHRLVDSTIKAVRAAYGTESWGATGVLNRYFEATDSTADHSWTKTKEGLFQVLDMSLGGVDAAGLLKAGAGAVRIAKGYVEVTNLVRDALPGIKLTDAVAITNKGIGVEYKAAKVAKQAAKEAGQAAGTAGRVVADTTVADKARTSDAAIQPGTAANIDATLNPNAIGQKMLQTITQGVDNEAYGLSKANTLGDGVLPRAAGDVHIGTIDIGPAIGLEPLYRTALIRAANIIAPVVDNNRGYAYRATEVASALDRTKDEVLQAFHDSEYGHVALNKSVIIPTAGGYLTQHVVTASPSAGFSTVQAAVEASQAYATKAGDSMDVLKKNPITNSYEVIPDKIRVRIDDTGRAIVQNELPTGEYALRINRATNIQLSDLETANLANLGNLGKHATQLDPASQFAESLLKPARIGEKMRATYDVALHEITRPFSDLGGMNPWAKRRLQGEVMEAIRDGVGRNTDDGRVFTQDELAARGLNVKQMDAYYAVRSRFDAEYYLNNTAKRQEMLDLGYKTTMTLEDGEIFHMKPASFGDLIGDGVKMVVNGKGELMHVTEEELRKFEEAGTKVFRPSKVMMRGDTQLRYVLVRAGDQVKNEALAERVLPYYTGYVPRIYDTNYILTAERTLLDDTGKEYKTFVPSYTAKGLGAAKKFVDAHPEYQIRYAREKLPVKAQKSLERSSYKSDNGIIFGARGEELGHVDALGAVDAERSLKDLGDVVNYSGTLTSYRQTMDEVIGAHESRWQKAYGDKWSLDEVQNLTAPLQPYDAQLLRDAQAYREYIAMLRGTDESFMTQKANSIRIAMANSVASGALSKLPNNIKNWIDERAIGSMNADLAQTIKTASFTTYMVLNPVSQLFLQGLQATMYFGIDGGFKYAATTQYPRDFLALMFGVAARNDSAVGKLYGHIADGAAKLAGRSPEQMQAMLDAFEASGIMQGLSRHSFVNSIMSSSLTNLAEKNLLSTSAANTWWYVKELNSALQKVGFNAGEFTNMSSAWLFARNKVLTAQPELIATIDTDLALKQQVLNDAVRISGSMDASARLKHQNGLLGVALQFTSYATKMTQAIIPRTLPLGNDAIKSAYFKTLGKYGSEVFSNREKLRIAAIQLGLFGMAGTPIVGGQVKDFGYWMYNTMLEDYQIKPTWGPDVERLITQGFMGEMVNRTFDAMYNDKTNVDVAARFTPIGDLQSPAYRAVELVAGLLQGDSSSVQSALGANWTTLSKGYTLFDDAVHSGGNVWSDVAIATNLGRPKPATLDEQALFFHNLAAMIPSINNWQAGEKADVTGYFSTPSGTRTVAAGEGEAFLRKWLGLRPVEEAYLLGGKGSLYGYYGEKQYGDAQKLDEATDKLWSAMKRYQVAHDNGTLSYQDFMNNMTWLTTYRNTALNDVERFNVQNKLAQKWLNEDGQGIDGKFIDSIAKGASAYDMRIGTAITKLKKMPDFQGKDQLMMALQNSLKDAQAKGQE